MARTSDFHWKVRAAFEVFFGLLFGLVFGCAARPEIFVPQWGIEPGPLAVKAQSSNHWTARKVLRPAA